MIERNFHRCVRHGVTTNFYRWSSGKTACKICHLDKVKRSQKRIALSEEEKKKIREGVGSLPYFCKKKHGFTSDFYTFKNKKTGRVYRNCKQCDRERPDRIRPIVDVRVCNRPKCENPFEVTSKNTGAAYCSRSCISKDKPSNRKGAKHRSESIEKMKAALRGRPSHRKGILHTEESKRKMSKSKIGQGRKEYPRRGCKNNLCSVVFQTTSRDPHKRFCNRPCANAYVGRNSKVGEINKGKTPSEGAGRCKWYSYKSKITANFRVQGTWELRLARCLDKIGDTWRPNHNRGRFYYYGKDGKRKSYAPDFWWNGWYVDVKGYMNEENQWKFDRIREQAIPIVIIRWDDLKWLEIQLFGKALCGVNMTPSALRKISEEVA